MIRITFRKPTQTPYLTVWERRAGRYGEDEPAPLDWSFRKLRGEFCGDGTLTLSRPPSRDGTVMEPGDWVQFWLPGDADDDPSYLGIVHSPLWGRDSGEIILKSPLYFVEMCAWESLLDANKVPIWDEGTVAEFLTNILNRTPLPLGITLGNLGSNPARVKARTDFELLKDTFSGIKPALEGGDIGVNAKGELTVYEPAEVLQHRFPRQFSQRPPGSYDGYANATTFPYTRPDDSETIFRFRDEAEVARRGAPLWLPEQLPAIIQAAKYIPPTSPVPVTLYVGYNINTYTPDLSNSMTVTASLAARDPAWTGVLADALGGASLAPLWGQDVRLPWVENELTLTMPQLASTTTYDDRLINGALSVTGEPGVTIRYTTNLGASWTAVDSPSIPLSVANPAYRIGYDPASFDAYVSSHGGQYPRGIDFELRGAWQRYTFATQTATNLPLDAYSFGATLRLATAATGSQSIYGQTSATIPATLTRIAPPAPGLERQVDIAIPEHEWLQGSAVWVRNGVYAKLSNATETLDLGPSTQAQVDEVYGSRFGVPRDFTATKLTLNGQPAAMGKVMMTGVNNAPLFAYARGLLRYRTRPVRRWTGEYHTLKRVPALDRAAFETSDGEDVVLDVQAVDYSAKERKPKVEAGTPLAVDLNEAVERTAYNLEQRIRAVNR